MSYYNDRLKKDFLATRPKTSIGNYDSLFNKSKLIENQKETDLYNFELNDLIAVISQYDSETWDGIQTQASLISKYIEWAFENNIRQNKYNPLSDVRSIWISDILKSKKVAITIDEFGFYSSTTSK